jgi:hypothetical protein
MADNDYSYYILRWNQVSSNLEAFIGSDWNPVTLQNTDPAQVPASRTISTTSPLTGGGDLSANRTLAIPAATNSVNGYLTSADHTTFAAKTNTTVHADSNSNLTGNVQLVSGTNVTLSQVGQAITINASGGGGSPNYQMSHSSSSGTITDDNTYQAVGPNVSLAASSNTAAVRLTADLTVAVDVGNTECWAHITKDGTPITNEQGLAVVSGGGVIGVGSAMSGTLVAPVSMDYIIVPGDTSSHTYAIVLKAFDTGTPATAVSFNPSGNTGMTITAAEIH